MTKPRSAFGKGVHHPLAMHLGMSIEQCEASSVVNYNQQRSMIMWKNRNRLTGVVLATGLAGLASIAVAQQPNDAHHPPGTAQPQTQATGRGMMGPGMMGQGMMGGSMMEMMAGCPMMGDGASMHVEGRVAFIRAELGITDAQKTVWEAYATALRKNLAGMQAGQKRMAGMIAAKTPIERVDAQLAVAESRHGALKEIKAPLVALYAALTTEQKAKANQLLSGMGCM